MSKTASCGCATHPGKRMLACPKCSSRVLTLVERIRCSGSFQQHADGSIDLEGYNSAGSYYALYAECNRCQHRWRVRRAIQITSVRDDAACPLREKREEK